MAGPFSGAMCAGAVRLCQTWSQVRNEQNSTGSRTCGVVAACSSEESRVVRLSFMLESCEGRMGEDATIKTICGTRSRPETGGRLAGAGVVPFVESVLQQPQQVEAAVPSTSMQHCMPNLSAGCLPANMDRCVVCVSITSKIRHAWSKDFISLDEAPTSRFDCNFFVRQRYTTFAPDSVYFVRCQP